MGGVIFADDAVSPVFTFDARYKSSGITSDAWVSYEAEGLSSRFSAAMVTRAADVNGNGIPDEWESRYGLVGDNADAATDSDGDGRTNLEEYNAGTNPTIFNDWMRSIAEQDKSFICDTDGMLKLRCRDACGEIVWAAGVVQTIWTSDWPVDETHGFYRVEVDSRR